MIHPTLWLFIYRPSAEWATHGYPPERVMVLEYNQTSTSSPHSTSDPGLTRRPSCRLKPLRTQLPLTTRGSLTGWWSPGTFSLSNIETVLDDHWWTKSKRIPRVNCIRLIVQKCLINFPQLRLFHIYVKLCRKKTSCDWIRTAQGKPQEDNNVCNKNAANGTFSRVLSVQGWIWTALKYLLERQA